MNVYLNKITVIDEALVSMLMSKQSWTRLREMDIREMVQKNTTSTGCLLSHSDPNFLNQLEKLVYYGIRQGHTTLLRFIDISFTVEGLHRGGQDDFDSHAKRLDNRIVRASTRLSKFKEDVKSNYYQGHILYPFEAMAIAGVEIPDYIDYGGIRYIRTAYGYVNERDMGNQDVCRGLYPLAIPSNFTFKCQYPELCHIIQIRDENSYAHPELQQMIKMIKHELLTAFPLLGKEVLNVKMEPIDK
jgi:hypothetical protein